jgi:undecaprenyl diphosphate synthase
LFKSSTAASFDATPAGSVPRHVAIIMDGNGRWANERFLPRVAGHKKGVDAVRETVKSCAKFGVDYLTLFAFSSENWRRPAEEVSFLMTLFASALEREAHDLARNDVRLKVVGDLSAFEPKLQALIAQAQAITTNSKGLTLTVAANYGGRWDILQATQKLIQENPALCADPATIQESHLSRYLAMGYAPEPDLFIRTGGEQRISNFLLWQMAYAEFYFTDRYWPDFNEAALREAIDSFKDRERRFGRTSQQVKMAVGE